MSRVAVLILTLFFLLCSSVTFAQAAGGAPDFSETTQGFFAFFEHISAMIDSVLNSERLNDFATILWRGFAAIGLVWLGVQYAYGNASVIGFLEYSLTVMLVKLLMNEYNRLTSAMWSLFQWLSQAFQFAATKHDGVFWLNQYVWDIMNRMGFGVSTLLHPIKLANMLLMQLLVTMLGAVSSLATVWSLWGFAVAKMLGFVLLPLLLFEKLSFLVDGWLRFLLGFLFFDVLARINLIIVVTLLQASFHLPSTTMPVNHVMHFDISTPVEGMGLLSILMLSIAGLISTGMFARSIVGGANIQLGAGLRQLSRGGAKRIGGILS